MRHSYPGGENPPWSCCSDSHSSLSFPRPSCSGQPMPVPQQLHWEGFLPSIRHYLTHFTPRAATAGRARPFPAHQSCVPIWFSRLLLGVSILDLLRALATVTVTTRSSTKLFTCQGRAAGLRDILQTSSRVGLPCWKLGSELGDKYRYQENNEIRRLHRALYTCMESRKLIPKLVLQNLFPVKGLFWIP